MSFKNFSRQMKLIIDCSCGINGNNLCYSNNKCLLCDDPNNFLNLETLECMALCPNGTVSIETSNRTDIGRMIKYCRGIKIWEIIF